MHETVITGKSIIGEIDLSTKISHPAIKRVVVAYPKVFRQRVRPLKIGIRWDLIEAGAPPKAVCAALESYTTTREYYKACRFGAKRYDMYGHPVGAVTMEEQTYADERLAILDMIAACRAETGTPLSLKKLGDSND